MPLQAPTSSSSSSSSYILLFFFSFLYLIVSMAAGAPGLNCQHECGGVLIPYPFGISDNCSWPWLGSNNEFQITCNNSFVGPPKPYLFGKHEIISIAVEAGEMRIYEPVSYICFESINQSLLEYSWEFDSSSSPLLISSTKNKLIHYWRLESSRVPKTHGNNVPGRQHPVRHTRRPHHFTEHISREESTKTHGNTRYHTMRPPTRGNTISYRVHECTRELSL